jgi:glycosyltransferase involved in cell wall biosynthesis
MGQPPARALRIAVVMPAYNHEAYVGEAIASVLEQDWPDLELHVLDDGSADGTHAVAAAALDRAGKVRCSLARQDNAGSARTLNRLIAGVDADLVAVLNSDDRYLPGRLRHLAGRAGGGDLLAFSGVAFDLAAEVAPGRSFEDWYRGKLAYALSLPTCGFALVTANLAISSSNFLFSRGLFDRVGGFDPALTLTQDWAFLLRALRWTEPRLDPRRLLYYRSHATNSFRQLMDVRIDQSRAALEAYVDWAEAPAPNRLAPTPANWPRFFQVFARSCAPAFSVDPVGSFLPASLLAASGPARATRQAEGAALGNLLAASRGRADNLRRGTDELLSIAAEVWQSMAAALAAGDGDG